MFIYNHVITFSISFSLFKATKALILWQIS